MIEDSGGKVQREKEQIPTHSIQSELACYETNEEGTHACMYVHMNFKSVLVETSAPPASTL